jgi:hypothetical protein
MNRRTWVSVSATLTICITEQKVETTTVALQPKAGTSVQDTELVSGESQSCGTPMSVQL